MPVPFCAPGTAKLSQVKGGGENGLHGLDDKWRTTTLACDMSSGLQCV
jgi:hypothetical protein